MSNPEQFTVDLGFIRWQTGVHRHEEGPFPPDPEVSRGTVLLVDDNPHMREISSAMLRHHGYRAVAVRDGMEALRVARVASPDVIVMDIDMPRMDGLQATRVIRDDPELGVIPVIVLTAHREAAYLQRAVQAGCTSYLRKPFNPRDLVTEITRILEPTRSSGPAR